MLLSSSRTENEAMSKHELKESLDELEFQVFRMRENLKKIAKKCQIIGIEQTKEEKWVVLYTEDDGNTCKIMLNDCETAYKGKWDFSIQGEYLDDRTIHIGDIKGPANKGFGSICMKYLKDFARDQNIPLITGDIVERDWNHVDRLEHFYIKHNFRVNIDHDNKSGKIEWNQNYQ